MSVWKRSLRTGVLGSVLACGVLAFAACSDDDDGAGSGEDQDGGKPSSTDGGLDGGRLDGGSRPRNDSGGGGGGDAGDGEQEECGALMATIRDFNPATHPDFEKFSGSGTKGLVKVELGTDRKPVFNEALGQITSAASFAQWYNDTPGINIAVPYPIPLTETPAGSGTFQFSSNAFFPVDNKGWATPPAVEPMSNGHNFNFTTEVHTSFTYRGGENFMFEGDDDLWIFVNGKLALDLGGLHSSLTGNIDFDALAPQLGITKGGKYNMDIFHAERHTTASNFTVRTTIECFKAPIIAI